MHSCHAVRSIVFAPQIFWLKNRKQEVWREKQNIEHAGGIDQKIDLSGLSDKDIEKLANMSDEE